jgi:CRISPR-associated protein Cas1
MLGRIVEIADDQRHLAVSRGFMTVKDTSAGTELGRVPLDDIAAVIANAHGLSYTNNFLVALAERGVPFALCGPNHNVVGMLFSIDGNYEQAKRIDAQIAAGVPMKKQLWAQIVRCKLQHQASVLQAVGAPDQPLLALLKKVRSGDTGNVEAQGARRYWTLLFGSQFRRDQDADGLNAMLNYGYTVLRACMARSIVAAGLHPSLGVHHSNAGNPMRLVDDLMEPFRPFVDLTAWSIARSGAAELTPDVKRSLVNCLYADLQSTAGTTPLSVCTQKLAVSLVKIYLGEDKLLDLPEPPLPLILRQFCEL